MAKGRRKPVEQHLAEGTYRADRHENRVRAKPVDDVPAPPRHISAPAKKVWKVVAAQVRSMGVLSESDFHHLAMYCESTVQYWKLKAEVEEEGYIKSFQTKFGTVERPNPKWKIVCDLFQQIETLGRRFGLTPVDRSRIKITDADNLPGDDLEDLAKPSAR